MNGVPWRLVPTLLADRNLRHLVVIDRVRSAQTQYRRGVTYATRCGSDVGTCQSRRLKA